MIVCPPTFASRRIRIPWLVALCLLSTVLPALSRQSDPNIQLRLAQGFERSGEWEKAATLYEELYQKAPDNYVYFDGLRRSYAQLKEYDKAAQIIRRRLALTPADPNLVAVLGGLRYQMGEPRTADSLWHSVVERDPQNVSLYRIVASQLIEYRLYEEATRLYREARLATGNQTLFAEELASLHGALMQYEAATREYVAILKASQKQPGAAAPQLAFIQSRLSSFTSRADGLEAAVAVLSDEVRSTPDYVPLRQLLAWLHMERHDYEAALEEYHSIDRLSGGNGSEIFSFAQRAAREEATAVAAKAFRDGIEHPGAARLRQQARLGYARAREDMADDAGLDSPAEGAATRDTSAWPVSETRATPEGVITLYEEIARDYPRTENAAQALFRIGVLRHDRLFDLDGAAAAFEEVRGMPGGRALAADASSRIGEILLEQNNLAQSRKEYERLLRQPQPEIQERARFALGELEYYEARFDSASSAFLQLTGNINNDLANDAIGYLAFLQENRGADAQLKEFAAADLLMRQHRKAQALEQFQEIVRRYPASPLIDDAWMRIGDLLSSLQQPDSALAAYRVVSDSLQLSILKDRALMRTAEVLERAKGDTAGAIAAYELVLTRFPASLFAAEARKRIRILRGDAL